MTKLSTLILVLLVSSLAQAQPGVDLRATFPAIKAYTSGPSAPVTKRFEVRPGLVRVRVIECPWYRCSDSVQFNAPVAGQSQRGAWGRFPGAEYLGTRFQPERAVEGANLESVSEYRVRQPLHDIEVGIFPSVVRFGDGSLQQLANSVELQIEFEPDKAAALPSGQTWEVSEEMGNQRWQARWSVLADGRSFDGTWTHFPGGESGTLSNFCHITLLQGQQIEINRPGLGTYRGTLSSDRRHISGTASWSGARWEVSLPTPLPNSL
ncbi:hypothetical protein JST97_20105 [bacterium]|nr:hypothetical protein [bacterium]